MAKTKKPRRKRKQSAREGLIRAVLAGAISNLLSDLLVGLLRKAIGHLFGQ